MKIIDHETFGSNSKTTIIKCERDELSASYFYLLHDNVRLKEIVDVN